MPSILMIAKFEANVFLNDTFYDLSIVKNFLDCLFYSLIEIRILNCNNTQRKI